MMNAQPHGQHWLMKPEPPRRRGKDHSPVLALSKSIRRTKVEFSWSSGAWCQRGCEDNSGEHPGWWWQQQEPNLANRVQSGIPPVCISLSPLVFSSFFYCPLPPFPFACWLPQQISASAKWIFFEFWDTSLAPVLLQTMAFVTKTMRARSGHEWFIHHCFSSNIIKADTQISASSWHFLYIFALISSLLLQMNYSHCSPTTWPGFKTSLSKRKYIHICSFLNSKEKESWNFLFLLQCVDSLLRSSHCPKEITWALQLGCWRKRSKEKTARRDEGRLIVTQKFRPRGGTGKSKSSTNQVLSPVEMSKFFYQPEVYLLITFSASFLDPSFGIRRKCD